MAQNEIQTKRIGEHTYSMYMLPPRKSNRLLLAVSKMIAPSIGPLLDSFFSSKDLKGAKNLMDVDLRSEFFSDLVGKLFSGLDEKTLDNVIDAFILVSEVNGAQMDNQGFFDLHFKGQLDAMYKWIAWGLSVQWGKSLSALISTIPASQGAIQPEVNPSESPST